MATPTLFFYDLETTGLIARENRIMQFGGQRTDLNLKPIGPAYNILIKQTKDVLPDPMAVLTHGITPQMTLVKGITEAEFLKLFHREIATPGTVFVGFNSVRFDDEFIRFLHYRNYYDPYEWHWSLMRSRWDILDVARMTRALRPLGLKWPFGSDGTANNSLELLSAINKLPHSSAHDALEDVKATIALADLIKLKQPKLFDWLLQIRNKHQVAKLVKTKQPFIYTSGKYPSEFEKTTAVVMIGELPDAGGALVYDLRHDPSAFAKLSPPELVKAWRYRPEESEIQLPIKTLKYNRCPAVAPLAVLDKESEDRLKLNKLTIAENLEKLNSIKSWPENLQKALEIMDKERQTALLEVDPPAESRLYDGFFDNADKRVMQSVQTSQPEEIAKLKPTFKDARLNNLWLPFKARNCPEALSISEKTRWQNYLNESLQNQYIKWSSRFDEIKQNQTLTKQQKDLLKELRSWLPVAPKSPEQE